MIIVVVALIQLLQKQIILIVEFIQTQQTLLWVVSAGNVAHNHQEKHDNNHQQVDCCLCSFLLAILIAVEFFLLFALANIITIDIIIWLL